MEKPEGRMDKVPDDRQGFSAQALRLALAHEADGIKAMALCDDAVMALEAETLARRQRVWRVLFWAIFAVSLPVTVLGIADLEIGGHRKSLLEAAEWWLFGTIAPAMLLSTIAMASMDRSMNAARHARESWRILYAHASAIRAAIDEASVAASEIRPHVEPPPIPNKRADES